MNPQEQLCPNPDCGASGQAGQIWIHSRKERRYRCKQCGRTFSETTGTALYQVKKPTTVFVVVVTLLAYGCPVQAIVMALGLDERTVQAWLKRAGAHCQQVHEHLFSAWQTDLQHLQADEMKIHTQVGTLWVGMVMMVSTRLWLGGVVHATRGKDLLVAVLDYARRCALYRPLLIATDGFNIYLSAIGRVFRTRRPASWGRPRWWPWEQLVVTQVMHSRRGQRGHFRQVLVQGTPAQWSRLMALSHGGQTIHSAFIERLNATFRQRLAGLARRSRALFRQPATLAAALFLTGCVYNFCTDHASLRLPLSLGASGRRHWVQRTPALAAGLTDHRWSVEELLRFRVLHPLPLSHPTGPTVSRPSILRVAA